MAEDSGVEANLQEAEELDACGVEAGELEVWWRRPCTEGPGVELPPEPLGATTDDPDAVDAEVPVAPLLPPAENSLPFGTTDIPEGV